MTYQQKLIVLFYVMGLLISIQEQHINQHVITSQVVMHKLLQILIL